MVAKTCERTEKVIEILKEAKGKPIHVKTLMDALGVGRSSVTHFMASLKRAYPTKVKSKTDCDISERGYYWNFDEQASEKEDTIIFSNKGECTMGPRTLERSEIVVTALKEAKGELVSGQALMDALGISKSALQNVMNELKRVYPSRIKSKRGGRVKGGIMAPHGYYWAFKDGELKKDQAPKAAEPSIFASPKKEESKKPVVNKYPYTHTEEGYKDPTATAAMSLVDDACCYAGDILRGTDSNSNTCYILVLASSGSIVTCLQVYFDKDKVHELEQPNLLKLVDGDDVIFYNPKKVTTKPVKYYTVLVTTISDEGLDQVRAEINKYLKLSSTQIVEKVVEKKVEVPVEVEKIVEKVVEVPTAVGDLSGYISIEEHEAEMEKFKSESAGMFQNLIDEVTEDMNKEFDKRLEHELTKQKAEIYQDVLEKFLKRKI